jgi:hypothetical protein
MCHKLDPQHSVYYFVYLCLIDVFMDSVLRVAKLTHAHVIQVTLGQHAMVGKMD